MKDTNFLKGGRKKYMFFTVIDKELDAIIQTGVNILIGVAAFVFIFMIITTGIKFMTANSAEEHQQAKSKLIWVIIGFALCVLCIVIFNVVWNIVSEYKPNPTQPLY